jgi:hypothetical protein
MLQKSEKGSGGSEGNIDMANIPVTITPSLDILEN